MITAGATGALECRIRACRHCQTRFGYRPRPVVQLGSSARILIASQAPGRRVHDSGIPFDDASGRLLRAWTGLTDNEFYDRSLVAIVPMAFCYPGRGVAGDRAPPADCARKWRARTLRLLPDVRLTLLVGGHAQRWHLGRGASLTETARNWRALAPAAIALPHPSPRNNPWLQRNHWFEDELLAYLRQRVEQARAGWKRAR